MFAYQQVPLTMWRTMELFKEAGFPDGVIQLVNGTAPVVGLSFHTLTNNP